MRVNEINGMAISDTSDFEQDERSFQPLIYLESVLILYYLRKILKFKGPKDQSIDRMSRTVKPHRGNDVFSTPLL